MTTSPEIAVIAVTYHSAELIPAFAASLRSATVRPVEAYIADNSEGADEQLRSAVAAEEELRLVEMPSNLGYGGAINAVARTLDDRIRWIVVVNPDVTFGPGSIDTLLDAAPAHPDAAQFGPRILTAEGDTYPSARRLPSLRDGIGHALFFRVWPRNPWSRRYLDAPESYELQRTAGWLSGACLLVRRSAFDEVGGFGDQYFMYFEDVDLGRKFVASGYENVFVPASVVSHLGAHATSQASARMERVHHESAYTYLAAKYHAWFLWPLRAALRIGLWARLALTTRRR
jgi:N-acetylglucosaminyl-diphospho-decaprenol L-rhamnosyltransferase